VRPHRICEAGVSTSGIFRRLGLLRADELRGGPTGKHRLPLLDARARFPAPRASSNQSFHRLQSADCSSERRAVWQWIYLAALAKESARKAVL